MWDLLFKAVGAALVALGIVIVGNVTIKWLTGRDLFEWWCHLRERVNGWVGEHQEIQIARIVGRLTNAIDDTMVRLKHSLLFTIEAVDQQGRYFNITEDVIAAHELVEQFPQLRQQPTVELGLVA
jgi:hypothetical protein